MQPDCAAAYATNKYCLHRSLMLQTEQLYPAWQEQQVSNTVDLADTDTVQSM
jgi:hypothetical protein